MSEQEKTNRPFWHRNTTAFAAILIALALFIFVLMVVFPMIGRLRHDDKETRERLKASEHRHVWAAADQGSGSRR